VSYFTVRENFCKKGNTIIHKKGNTIIQTDDDSAVALPSDPETST
jgi:hypothetical protein